MQPVQYFNRYTRTLETERIYGEPFLRWTYETVPGQVCLRFLVKRAWFSRWYGWRMDRPKSRNKIAPFIATYDLDESEFETPADQFRTFNEFFYRRLKPEARPIHPDPNRAVFPADGRHLGMQNIGEVQWIFAKGQRFDLQSLFNDGELAKRYQKGSVVLSRLCPVDYHRFHFPVGGPADRSRPIQGDLSSVNPIALKRRIEILTENKRELTRIRCERFGEVLMMEIGATCVGGIRQTYPADSNVAKGREKGYFEFGGSMTAVFFEENRIRLDDDLVRQSREGRELYARMGDSLGRAL